MQPEIRPDTLKGRSEKERHGGAFLASLLSKLGLGELGGGAAAGSGVWGAAGQAGILGGILATKAGVVALVLAGGTVAAGIGIIGSGHGVFAPASGDPAESGGLFFLRRSGPAPAEQPKASPDGASASLGHFVSANAGSGVSLGDAPADGSGVPGQPGGGSGALPDNANAPANLGSPGGGQRLTLSKALSGAGSPISGGGFSPAAPSPGGAAAKIAPGSGKGAGTSGLSKGKGTTFGVTGKQAVGAGRAGALGQLMGVKGDAARTLRSQSPSSQSAGLTYDGGKGASPIGGAAGGIGGGGMGTGGAGVGAGAGKVNPMAPARELPPPPKPAEGKNETPYQWAMYAAMAAMGVALIAFMVMSFAKKKHNESVDPQTKATALMVAKIAGGIAAAAAAVATAMGVIIMTAYGQMAQGGMWTAIGGIFTAIAAYQWWQVMKTDDDAQAQNEAGGAGKSLSDEVRTQFAAGKISSHIGQSAMGAPTTQGAPMYPQDFGMGSANPLPSAPPSPSLPPSPPPGMGPDDMGRQFDHGLPTDPPK